MTNDDIDDVLRVARPDSVKRSDPVGPRAEADLIRIMSAPQEFLLGDDSTGPGPKTQGAGYGPDTTNHVMVAHLRRKPLSLLALAASILVVAFIRLLLHQTAPNAHSETPPPLDINRVDAAPAASSILLELAELAEAAQSPPEPMIDMETWELVSPSHEGNVLEQDVESARTTVRWGADGAAYVSTWEKPAESYLSLKAHEPAEALGKPLERRTYQAGSEQLSVDGPAPTDAEALRNALTAGCGLGPWNNGVTAAIGTTCLLQEQVLDPDQLSALLELLATTPHLELAGETKDRFGRPALAFEGRNPQSLNELSQILIDPNTGRVLATEEIYLGSDRPEIDPGSVVYYSAWR